MTQPTPQRFRLAFDSTKGNQCAVMGEKGMSGFSAAALRSGQKLYVVSVRRRAVYVGVTSQPMGTRLRYGFTATGRGGYHGYAWRRSLKNAVLDVWCPKLRNRAVSRKDVETIEAEVVFLIRQSGQWPKYQTEIHFHQSKPAHRRIAAEIREHYR